MSVITDEYKREIQKIKMELSDQIEENVRLKGFKQMVLEKPDDFDNDKSFENDTRTNPFDEVRNLHARVKRLDNSLASALEINESHQRYNGKLQVQVTELKEDNKKLSQQISDYIKKHEDSFRKAGI
jgi:hypothetical protein